MSTNSDQGQCFKCLKEGVERPGVIDYCGGLVCRDHNNKDMALDAKIAPGSLTEREIDVIAARGSRRMGANSDS